ncbi:MAG TPA: glycosyltransferase [Brevibacterium sp.]|nr:glycosyltransferase [Brevibacterium sp.]
MRLLYVIDSLAPGGAETSLVDMAPGLVGSGIDLHVLPLGHRLDLLGPLADSGAEVHLRNGGAGRLASVRAVRAVARSIRADLVHTTLFEADVAGRLAAWTLGLPSSTSLVNDSYGASHYAESNTLKLHLARAADAATARPARRFHAITAAIADRVAARIAIPRAKIEVIPRGRNPSRFPFRPVGARQATRAALGISPAAPVVLTVGRLEPQKGHPHLVRAASLVAAEHRDLVVLIAGKDGRSADELRSLASRQGVDIRFLGHRSDVAELMAASDVFCFPSEREGFGGVLLEAMASGCPIVASDIPTSREVLWSGEGSVGILCPPQPEAIARSIEKVLHEDTQSAAMAARARKHFESHFTIDEVTSQMAAFFDASRIH